MQKVFLKDGKEKIIHKFKNPKVGEEIVTSLTFEKWERNGKKVSEYQSGGVRT